MLGVETLEMPRCSIHGEVEHLIPTHLRLIFLAIQLPIGLDYSSGYFGEVEQTVVRCDAWHDELLDNYFSEFILREL